MKNIFTTIFVSLLLAGCASEQYKQNLEHNDKVHQQIGEYTNYIKPEKVQRFDKPPVEIVPISKTKSDTSWMNEKLTTNYKSKPLSLVLDEIMYPIDVPIYFSENVDPNKRISFNYSHTRKNILNLISRVSGYGIEYINDRLEVTKFVTRVFPLNIPSGMVSGQLGSQGTSKDSGVRVEGQFINVAYKDLNFTQEIADSIKAVLGGSEAANNAVAVLPSMTSISVTATPDQMQTIEEVINAYQAEISKQVFLEIQVLEFKSNLDTERGINWNIVKDMSDGTLQFFVPGTNTVSQDAGYGLGFIGADKWTGTEALIKVLEKQGTVSTQTPITALILNNQPAKLTQQREEPYLYETSSDNSDGVVTASVTRDKEREGVDMMINAKVSDEYAFLRISGQLRKIESRDTKKVQQIDLGMISTQSSEITFANKARYGQTYVIASVKQSSKTAESSKNFWSTLFGGTGSSNRTTETLVLLTPRKAM